ncbi:MAG TPA: hypothetical protein VNA69_00600 [Thermoanaerobaculia bacterium]|nr:hypothetical protein [Thermoanaerobaculia bacterium]
MRAVVGARTDLPWNEIQGLILRGYSHPKGRHFVLHFPDVVSGRRFVAAIAPKITTAEPWSEKPAHCINIGFTADGLRALGLTVDLSNNFPQEFVDGAIARANAFTKVPNDLGDHGESAPEKWDLSLGIEGQTHAILSTIALDDGAREAVTAEMMSLFQSAGIESLGNHDADDLPDSQVHFGYRDSISQPNIEGAPPRKYGLYSQPVVATGEFVLGYPNQSGFTMPLPLPSTPFAKNGCYSAFRILQQNVPAFFDYVEAQAVRLGVPASEIQANFCGRQPDGTPLAGSTHGLNDFDYSDDKNGKKCPYDAHIRRGHPRNSLGFGPAPDGEGYRHRILRRALPYGRSFDPQNADRDSTSRGLIGHFMGASLAQQFEFVMTQWINGVTVANNHDDALIGDNVPSGRLQMANGTTLQGFTRFTVTRGSAYVFFPSIAGLHYLG